MNQIKGKEYEKFVRDHLRDKYDQVWLWSDVPEKILIEHNIIKNYDSYSANRLINRKDIGIDVIGVKSNKLFFIQCKNYTNNVCINDIQCSLKVATHECHPYPINKGPKIHIVLQL